MPATARLPSGTWVELLGGQPEQNQGERAAAGTRRASCSSLAARYFTRSSIAGLVWKRARRFAITLATVAGESSEWDGRIQSAASSYLPTTWGRAPSGMS